MRPAKTQISLDIRPDWSESLLCDKRVVKGLSYLHTDIEDWANRADAQADLSFRGAHMPLCWFLSCRIHLEEFNITSDALLNRHAV